MQLIYIVFSIIIPYDEFCKLSDHIGILDAQGLMTDR